MLSVERFFAVFKKSDMIKLQVELFDMGAGAPREEIHSAQPL